MRRPGGLQIASAIVIVLRIAAINTTAQNPLLQRSIERDEWNHKALASAEEAPPTVPIPVNESVVEKSTKSSPSPLSLSPNALAARDPRKLGLVDIAYLDAFTILKEDNSCSRFFGGPLAVTALNDLVRRLKPTYLDRNIAIRMTGATTTVQSNATGFAYRLFERAEINLAGSFFRGNTHASISSRFRPNTRETRVLVLLHELGHLVKSPEKQWLLPDDGADLALSLANTDRVLRVCEQQIDSLSNSTPAMQFQLAFSERP